MSYKEKYVFNIKKEIKNAESFGVFIFNFFIKEKSISFFYLVVDHPVRVVIQSNYLYNSLLLVDLGFDKGFVNLS